MPPPTLTEKVDRLDRELVALRSETAAFKARFDTLIGVARFGAGALVAILGVVLTFGVWAIYGAGRIEAEVRTLGTRVTHLEDGAGRIEGEVKNLGGRVARLEDGAIRIEAEVKNLGGRVARVEEGAVRIEAAVNNLGARGMHLEETVQGFGPTINGLAADMKTLMRRMDAQGQDPEPPRPDRAPGPGPQPGGGAKFGLNEAEKAITADGLLGHIKTLASDDFEGRGPGTPGEEKTVRYLTDQFRALGLKPGNPDGSYTQDVPLVGFTTKSSGSIRVDGQTIDLKRGTDWMAVSRRFRPEAEVKDSEVVFVGYGVVAPEYGWDDYKDVDVRGKTIVMLINDPAVPDPKDPSQLDPDFFKGRAMTYYGRWTYKYEIAAEKGAAAALIVHEEGPAGYPFEVVVGSWGRENFDIPAADRNEGRPVVEAWLSLDATKTILSACGQDFGALKEKAVRKDFRPVALGARARFSVQNTLREIKSKNVVARLEGSDPKRKDETVVYTAHWDHLGRDESLAGDQIYNGAADNASGVAALLEIARAFTRLDTPPKRSILFLAVTAEEKGLLGAKSYAAGPLYPLETTLADINMDVINLWGRTEDILSIGYGNSTLDDLLEEAARARGRVVKPDAEPEKGYFYRSDHFEFAKQGVPALDPKGGMDYVGRPEGYGKEKHDEYTKNHYHKVSDEVKPDWDLSGAVEDLRLLFEVGYRVAQGDRYPEWKPGTEFKAKREAMLRP